jgi:amino acid transporter
LLARVDQRTGTPLVAIVAVTVAPLALVLSTAPFAAALFDAMAKMATMALYVSYMLPILLGALARRRGTWKTLGPWNLRSLGPTVAWSAVVFCAFVLVVCSLPPNQLPAAMLLGIAGVFAAIYFAFVRRRFTGPTVTLKKLEGAPCPDHRDDAP